MRVKRSTLFALVLLICTAALVPSALACYEPPPEQDPTPRKAPTKTIICYDFWEFMDMPWETNNPIAGFHIYEAGKYRVIAIQEYLLIWESPVIHVWHSQGLNLIYYVGGLRFYEGYPITFVLMKDGKSVADYHSPFF